MDLINLPGYAAQHNHRQTLSFVQNRTTQDRTVQDRSRQVRTGQVRTVQDKSVDRQDTSGQVRNGQNSSSGWISHHYKIQKAGVDLFVKSLLETIKTLKAFITLFESGKLNVNLFPDVLLLCIFAHIWCLFLLRFIAKLSSSLQFITS